MKAQSKYILVDGVRTHYFDAGEGPPVVLLHSGEFGGCAELSWEFNFEELSHQFRVIAPDFLGFGRTDKLRDFVSHGTRMIEHMSRFLETMCIDEADFIGNSMSGRFLCRVASQHPMVWPIRRMVVASGGGFEPDNAARRTLQDYDASMESMRSILKVLFHNPKWYEDETYVQRRYDLSLMPGAWEVAAAARFKSPAVPPRPQFGRPDRIPYESITVPVLYAAGDQDALLLPGYANELAERTPKGEVLWFERCGHCPNIENPDQFNRAVTEFFTRTMESEEVEADAKPLA